MRYNLSAMAMRAKKTRRTSITLRPITAPSTLASDLYASAYALPVKAWTEATPQILVAYERALSTMTRDSPAEIGRVLGGVDDEISRLVLSIRLRLEQWALKVERYHRSKWRGAVLSATGIDLQTMLGAGDMRTTIEGAIERNVGLVKSVSEQARTRIGEAVFRGLNQRRTAREVAGEIREAVAMSRRRALNIAADQTVKIAAQLNSERRKDAGIDTWEWVSSHKVNYRPEHQARDGKRYSDDDPPEDLPSELPNCGCTERAVLSLESEF